MGRIGSKVNIDCRRGKERILFFLVVQSFFKSHLKRKNRNFSEFQWLRLAAIAGSGGLIPSWGSKIPHAEGWGQNKKFPSSHCSS